MKNKYWLSCCVTPCFVCIFAVMLPLVCILTCLCAQSPSLLCWPHCSTRRTATAILYISQEYVRELAICIALGGPRLRNDLTCYTGRHLSGLIAEIAILLGARAKTDLQAYKSSTVISVLPLAERRQKADGAQAVAASSAEPD